MLLMLRDNKEQLSVMPRDMALTRFNRFSLTPTSYRRTERQEWPLVHLETTASLEVAGTKPDCHYVTDSPEWVAWTSVGEQHDWRLVRGNWVHFTRAGAYEDGTIISIPRSEDFFTVARSFYRHIDTPLPVEMLFEQRDIQIDLPLAGTPIYPAMLVFKG